MIDQQLGTQPFEQQGKTIPIQVIRQLVPPSNQRDDLLQEIEGFRDYMHRALTAEAGE